MNNLVFIEKNQVVTDSLTVAEVFDKRHDSVLRDIRVQANYSGPEFAAHNFVEGVYKDRNNQSRPKIKLTEEAFTLVAMSYNTREAVQMKVKFIQEFKRMKNELTKSNNPSYMIDDPIQRAEKWIEERKRYQTLETKAAVLEQRVAEYEPKISYLDTILNTKDTVTITQIADDYGMTGQKFNKLLHEIGIQYKLNGQWLLYSKFKGEGYTKSQTLDVTKNDGSTKVVMNTRWTQKGRLFLYEKLKAYDVLPLMDQDLDKSIRLAK